MNGQSDYLALIGDGALDGLPDPPPRVSAELCTFRWIKPINRHHQSDVSFGNEVKQRQTVIRVVARDRHDETQVRADHELARLAVAVPNLPRELDLLLRCEQGGSPDFT